MRILFLLTLVASAEFQDLWRLGISDNKCDEFSMESHTTEEESSKSAETLDDHYYFKGRYEKVGTVSEDEPLKNFERALKQSDPIIELHFSLEEVETEKEYRVELDFVWGGHLDGGTDWEHVLQVSMNEEEVGVTPPHKKAAFYYISVPAQFLKIGENTLQIKRRDDGEDAYTSIDTLALQSSSKHIPDTDKDGVSDDWEKYAGTDWKKADSTPEMLKSLIGINFISAEYPEEGSWLNGEVNGYIPQANWNQFGPLRQWHIEGKKEQRSDIKQISGPRFGQIVDASGEVLPEMEIRTRQSRCATSHNNLGSPAAHLLNGFLDTDNEYSTKIELKKIPYDSYDLYVYVSSDHSSPQIKVSVDGAEPQLCQALGSTPITDFLYTPRTSHPNPPFSNVLKFSALSKEDLTIKAERENEKTIGIAAIQVVDREADADEDKIPDWYELQHGLHYADKWDGNKDPDEDRLNNREEYALLTDPQKADTDGDGLPDTVETNTGVYKNRENTGTNPLLKDTDGDRLSDLEEISSYVISNPLKSDTDEDGASDKEERRRGTSPNSQSLPPYGIQQVEAGKRFSWEFPNVQLIWDHGKMASDDWRKKSLFHIDCLNLEAKDNSWGSFQIFMHHTENDEVYFGCFSRASSGFKRKEGEKEIWMEKRDGDYKKALGFSGKGVSDLSDPLHLKMEFLLNPETKKWDLTYTVKNLHTKKEIVRIEHTGFTPVPSIEKGNAKWKEYNGLPYAVHTHNGITFLQSAENLKKRLRNEEKESVDLKTLLSKRSSLNEASRFLKFASFGPTPESVLAIEEKGYKRWIKDQLKESPTYLSTYVNTIYEDYYGDQLLIDQYGYNSNNNTLLTENIRTGFARAAISSDDQLRQRVAYALSQLIVVSRKDDTVNKAIRGLAGYYDIFVEHAFGNYKDILREVTYHPCMGTYLSSAGSAKANPELNLYPDENYARELMQLFTCGLWQLKPNGERLLDKKGSPIPTYNNDEITECARVFTGLWFAGNHWKGGGWQGNHFINPMDIHVGKHDFLEKNVISGKKIPERAETEENARKDIEDMLTILIEHPSTAPFISRFLIQQLITDNPSPAYIERVSQVFSDNGKGIKGDLKAIIETILLDPEALNNDSPTRGKLTEPILRYMQAARLLKFADYENLEWWDYGDFRRRSSQEPLNAPSVFNFYSSDYDGKKELRDHEMVSPVFQITNDYTSVSFPNELWRLMENGLDYGDKYHFSPDYRDFLAIGDDTENLIQYVNLLCCGGGMEEQTRNTILETIKKLDPNDLRGKIKLILFISLTCPEGAVQH